MILDSLIKKAVDMYVQSTESEDETLKKAGKWGYTDLGRTLKYEKKIGILGLPSSGKKTLDEYLTNYPFDLTNYSYIASISGALLFIGDYEGRSIKGIFRNINITNIKSNEGNSYHKKYDYSQEMDILHTSDIILYLFDIAKLFTATEKDKYLKTIRKEIEVYSQVLNPSQKKIFIALGTHSDKLKDLELTRNEIETQLAIILGDFKKVFSYLDHCSGMWEIRFFNSLVDSVDIDIMMFDVFSILDDYYSNKKYSKDYEEYNGFKFKVLRKSVKHK